LGLLGRWAQRGRRWDSRIEASARRLASALPILVILPGSAGAVDEFHGFLQPQITFAEIGSTAMVTLAVDSTARHFNGYEIEIRFDPSIVTFTGVTEGALMIGGCPQRFRHVATTDSTVTYTHVLLCAGTTVDGPGELSHFSFHADALGRSPVDPISDLTCTFFDLGQCVGPDHPTDPREVTIDAAEIRVYDPLTGVALPSPLSLPTLVRPSPSAGTVWISLDGERAEEIELRVYSADGAEVGSRRGSGVGVAWSSGTPGLYWYRVRAGARTGGGRFVILR